MSFFARDAVTGQKAADHVRTGRDVPGGQFRDDLMEKNIRRLFDEGKNDRAMGLNDMGPLISSHRQGRTPSFSVPDLAPAGCRGPRHQKATARRTRRKALFQKPYKASSQITRIGFSQTNRPPNGAPLNQKNAPMGIPRDSTRSRITLGPVDV